MANVLRSDGSTSVSGSELAGWVSEPNVRGTAALVFTCISTVLICTWNAVHLNAGREGKSHLARFWVKIQCLGIALVAPEFIAFASYCNLDEARAVNRQMSDYSKSNEWSTVSSYFVVMGGVIVRSTDGTRTCLPPDMVREFVEKDWISLEHISPHIIEDKSKASWFNKSLATIQITFFLAQLLGRVITHLSVTTLELFTLAYVGCAVLAYGCWWSKPFDVQIPIVLDAPESFTAAERANIISRTSDTENYGDAKPDPLSSYHLDQAPWFAVLCCGLFGGCHILGWNAYFPTHIELILWRVGSVACVILPLSVLFWSLIEYKLNMSNRMLHTIAVTTVSSYTIVRLLLLFEAFFALRRVPADVYISLEWNQFMPHL